MKTLHFLLIFTTFFAFARCTPTDNYAVIPSQGSVCATAKHHANLVPEVDMYLKYNTDVFLGWDYKKYDKHLQADTLAHTCFDSLPVGTHCIMVLGYDRAFGADIYGYKLVKIAKIADKQTIDILVSE